MCVPRWWSSCFLKTAGEAVPLNESVVEACGGIGVASVYVFFEQRETGRKQRVCLCAESNGDAALQSAGGVFGAVRDEQRTGSETGAARALFRHKNLERCATRIWWPNMRME